MLHFTASNLLDILPPTRCRSARMTATSSHPTFGEDPFRGERPLPPCQGIETSSCLCGRIHRKSRALHGEASSNRLSCGHRLDHRKVFVRRQTSIAFVVAAFALATTSTFEGAFAWTLHSSRKCSVHLSQFLLISYRSVTNGEQGGSGPLGRLWRNKSC